MILYDMHLCYYFIAVVKRPKSNSNASTISTASMKQILDKLKSNSCRKSTKDNYLGTWRRFNKFVIKLDVKPAKWEDRVSLFIAQLITEGKQSSSIKSYVSAIKKTLINDGYPWDDSLILLTTLTRACRLENDRVRTRLPIQCGLFELLLFEIQREFHAQPFLDMLYKAMFALGYYGLMRVSELCLSTINNHAVKARDIHMATNKQKILIILHSSKTHGKESRPQKIKIIANKEEKAKGYRKRNFCPFSLVHNYIKTRRQCYGSIDEPFFVFQDGTPVRPEAARILLKNLLSSLGLDSSLYGMHSLRIGRSTDLVRYGYTINQVKFFGHWRSNTVYKYIRN